MNQRGLSLFLWLGIIRQDKRTCTGLGVQVKFCMIYYFTLRLRFSYEFSNHFSFCKPSIFLPTPLPFPDPQTSFTDPLSGGPRTPSWESLFYVYLFFHYSYFLIYYFPSKFWWKIFLFGKMIIVYIRQLEKKNTDQSKRL